MSDPDPHVNGEAPGSSSPDLLLAVFLKNPVAMVVTAVADGIILDVNEAACRLFGYARSEMIGTTVFMLGLYDRSEERTILLDELRRDQVILRRNLFVRTKDGERRNILLNLSLVQSAGREQIISSFLDYPSVATLSADPVAAPVAVAGTEGLTQAEERLRWALQSAGGGVWDFDLVSGVAWWSEEMYRLWGVPAGDRMMMQNSVAIIHPDDREQVERSVVASIAQGTPYRSEFRIIHPERGERWMVSLGKPFFNEAGQAVRLLGISLDVTARKTEEERLRHLDGVLRAMRNVSLLITRERDRERLLTHACTLLTEDRGYSSAFIARRDQDGRYHVITREGDEGAFQELRLRIEAGELPACCRTVMGMDDVTALHDSAIDCKDCVHCHRRGDSAALAGRLHHDGRDHGMIVVALPSAMADDPEERSLFKEFTDELALTLHLIESEEENRRSTEALRASEQRLLLFIEHAPAAIAIFDRGMHYLAASGRWIADYHLGGKDIIGQSHYEIFPEITEVWKEVHRAGMMGEVVSAEEDRFVRLDGSVQWLRWEVRPWRETTGNVGGIIIFSEDITERKEAAMQVIASLREKEVLLKEIHHRVKNNLQVISSLLSMQSAALTDATSQTALQDSRNRVRSMALVHERLYRSGNLASIDFGMYLQDVTAELHRSYRIPHVRLACEVDSIQMEIDMAVPCGLIVNELVSNALKHAFPAGHEGLITVRLQRLDELRAALSVADDGVGLPAGLDVVKAQSMGMTLLQALAAQVDAQVNVETGPGTRFTITLPLMADGRK